MSIRAVQQARSGVPLVVLGLFLGAAAARAEGPVWVPATAVSNALVARGEVVYEGLAGMVLSTAPDRVAMLERIGGVSIDLRPGETGWVYLVENADRAEFEPPGRVLLRAGHEVVVATDGSVPRLTGRSEASLRGLKQPVRLRGGAVPARPVQQTSRAVLGQPDPVVEQMVADLTQAHYVATWQALDDFENRHTYASQNETATQWILEQFRSFGLRSDFHYYEQNGQRRNVIATLPGIVDSAKVVYICAHLDATSGTSGVCAPGADDNASGTAAVIEAARVMSQYRFQYTVKFAAFNGEEQGLVGSQAYVANLVAAGEDVVGVFNCDMIAYRGTDAAPPDLVIYTNGNSQALATTLADAAGTYLPGLLEPIVHVETMSGSDHASFWWQGYRAVCSIESEPWGTDFSPWYHTCNDRIERYPQDYAHHCARANLAALAITAIPLAPSGPFLAMGPTQVDDDANGGSSGNGDGAPNPGETLELLVTVRNVGAAASTNVSGVLRSQSAHATVLDSASAWSDIPAGGQATNQTVFRVSVAQQAGDGEDLPLLLEMQDDVGSHPLDFSLRTVAPLLTYRSLVVDDGPAGNQVPDPGEILMVSVVLANAGHQDAGTVLALLTSANPHLTVLAGEASVPLIAADGQATLSPAYRVGISPDAADGEDLALNLSITADDGYMGQSAFAIRVGTYILEEMEMDAGWSTAAPDDNASSGRWVRVDPIGTFQNGQPAQPEDDRTPAPGTMCFVTGQGPPDGNASQADVDGGKTTLRSPVFDLTRLVQPRVGYWRWYSNNLGGYPNEDTWLVQVSNDGGNSWVDLERTTSSANGWQRMSFLLESYVVPSTQMVFRFVASDAGAGSLVEAAVDDFEIEADLTPVAVAGPRPSSSLRLDPPSPNPGAGGTMISFDLPTEGNVVLKLFGVDGRLVRTLVSGSLPVGPHRVLWDGESDSGRPAAPGVYFCRLEAARGEIVRRITLMR
jgi:hypothetical protein